MAPRRPHLFAATSWPLVLALALGCHPRGAEAPDGIGLGGPGGEALAVHRAPLHKGEAAPVLDILATELETNLSQLSGTDVDDPVYYLGYSLISSERLHIEAQSTALLRDERDHERRIDVDVRVGSPQLDNTHSRDGNYGPGNGLGSALNVSLDDDPLSLAQGLWLETEAQYHDAVSALREVEAAEQLRSSDDQHPDFSREKPSLVLEAEAQLDFDAVAGHMRPIVRQTATILGDSPMVLASSVTLTANADNRYFVSSEGSRVQTGQTLLRVFLHAQTQADDGMVLELSETYEAQAPSQLPDAKTLATRALAMRQKLIALRSAPIADPYTGPAVLEGRAAGVFFHEIFGHRLEGHRQKDDAEGQTFSDRIGKRVLPSFLDVVDDPTISTLGSTPLSGHYFVDDEGISAKRTLLVDRGKLRTFLLGRSPVLPFRHSNGHGRREPGFQTVARQGNLIVSSRRTMSTKDLREALVEEIQRQKKPYGLWFTDISGGYTLTDRSGPQAFKVQPLLVYRIYADGRPDELVRGVEIVGTPLQAFETIMATDDRPGIFNGLCGAESGWVPVSAVSPSLLLRDLEIERGQHDRDKPPLLPAPATAAPRDNTP